MHTKRGGRITWVYSACFGVLGEVLEALDDLLDLTDDV